VLYVIPPLSRGRVWRGMGYRLECPLRRASTFMGKDQCGRGVGKFDNTLFCFGREI
jgi:hypothetical protein